MVISKRNYVNEIIMFVFYKYNNAKVRLLISLIIDSGLQLFVKQQPQLLFEIKFQDLLNTFIRY